jgi:hypothetical protein
MSTTAPQTAAVEAAATRDVEASITSDPRFRAGCTHRGSQGRHRPAGFDRNRPGATVVQRRL